MLSRLFGGHDEEAEDEGTGGVEIRISFRGKVFTQRYADLDMAQLRFPQYLADLNAVHGREFTEEPDQK